MTISFAVVNALKVWYSHSSIYYVTCANIGPWDINDGLCTLEEHRNLPIEVQAKTFMGNRVN